MDSETWLENGRLPETPRHREAKSSFPGAFLLPSGQSCMLWHCPAFVGRLNGCAHSMVPAPGPEDLLSLSRAEAQCVTGLLGVDYVLNE